MLKKNSLFIWNSNWTGYSVFWFASDLESHLIPTALSSIAAYSLSYLRQPFLLGPEPLMIHQELRGPVPRKPHMQLELSLPEAHYLQIDPQILGQWGQSRRLCWPGKPDHSLQVIEGRRYKSIKATGRAREGKSSLETNFPEPEGLEVLEHVHQSHQDLCTTVPSPGNVSYFSGTEWPQLLLCLWILGKQSPRNRQGCTPPPFVQYFFWQMTILHVNTTNWKSLHWFFKKASDVNKENC